ncbi:MAG: replication factor C large subunit [Candidatus Pacearchaeota archaeon]|nr:replication factor C large subunit [Candidatus Pacearchaeota archaeon]
MNAQNWSEKYRPKTFSEIVGQNDAIQKIQSFTSNLSLPRSKKAILLHGGPGIGKTTLAQVIANETNSEIFELNASDLRNKPKLREILRPAIEQMSLLNKNKIILIDEADGITGTDRGGITEIITLISQTKYPIILTANNAFKQKLSPLRKKVELIELKEISPSIIKEILNQILKKENKFIHNKLLNQIAIKSRGDLRAAINDLQTLVHTGNTEDLELSQRNKETDIFNALKKIFKEKPTPDMLKTYDSVNMNIDEIILWVEENIPKEYTGQELARAYDLLSKTDLFKGRIYKQQYWRFLLYENIFLSYGIASAKTQEKTKFTTYKRPSRILKIWLNNQKTAKKKSIAIKYAEYVHVGYKRALNEFPIIKQIINSNPQIAQELKLTQEEIEYISKE